MFCLWITKVFISHMQSWSDMEELGEKYYPWDVFLTPKFHCLFLV